MTMSGEPVLLSLYIYKPNKIAAIGFTAFFAISAVFHVWQCYRYGAFKLIGLQPVCAVLFAIGFAFRVYGSFGDNYIYDPDNVMPLIMFVLSEVFIYACPPLLELCNYHVLGRIFDYVPYSAPIPGHRVLRAFGSIMVIVEALNGIGVSFASNPKGKSSSQRAGKYLSIAALPMQVAVICSFIIVATICVRRLAKLPKPVKNVTVLMYVLFASMALILGRCTYRLIEYSGNTKKDLDDIKALRALGPIFRYEWLFLVFEASSMLINSAIWNVWHPGRFLPKDRSIHLNRRGSETVGKKIRDNRSRFEKTLHYLTFGVMYGNKQHDIVNSDDEADPERRNNASLAPQTKMAIIIFILSFGLVDRSGGRIGAGYELQSCSGRGIGRHCPQSPSPSTTHLCRE